MSKYELAVVLSSKLEDAQRNEELEKVKGYITRFNGNLIGTVEEWGRKKLAYEINHEKEGFYYFIQFEGDNTTSNEITSYLRIMENVLRFLIVKQ